MNKVLWDQLIAARNRYLSEGFVLMGAFGSRARGDHHPDSDLDLLYRLDDEFLVRHSEWEGISRIEEIRQELGQFFGISVDLADSDALRESGRRFILPDMIDVPQVR